MPEDDRPRRRLGDETRGRIAELASGWEMPGDEEGESSTGTRTPEPRRKQRTMPPPPPGSHARAQRKQEIPREIPEIEDLPEIPEIEDDDEPPRPPPLLRRTPPPLETSPRVAVERDAYDAHDASSSEFDVTQPRMPDPPPRAEPPPPRVLAQHPSREDPTRLDSALDRGDPTTGGDATRTPLPSSPSAHQRLRTIAQLQRRRGVGGDMRYVLTAIFGLRRTRRELAALEITQGARQKTRRRHLVTLGRIAVSADGFEHAALAAAQGQLRAIEDERTRHTGQVATADAELQRFTRARNDAAAKHATEVAAIDAQLAELGKQLEPLEKDVARATRRGADLRDGLRRIAEQIAAAEATLATATPEQRGSVEAEIASLVAERKELRLDEPALAGKLDALHPRIAALDAARAEARARRAELDEAELADQRRTEEVLAAIGAKRKVVDRAAGDAETRRDKVLFELGEHLYVDRPDDMAAELSPIDAIDLELGTGDRRTMELREILQSVDRGKIVRGAALWILVLAAAGAVAGWTLRMVL